MSDCLPDKESRHLQVVLRLAILETERHVEGLIAERRYGPDKRFVQAAG